MSIEPQPTPPSHAYRFPLRTLLVLTTTLAIIAAIAGTYYRSVESEAARNKLIGSWSLFSVFVAGSLFARGWEAWRASAGREVRYIVHARGRRRQGRWSTISTAACCLAVGLWIAVGSYGVVLETQQGFGQRSPLIEFALIPLHNFGIIGAATSALIFSLIRRPMFLCEEGVPLRSDYLIPWNHIVHAEWQTDRPATLKLHQVTDDVYLDVPIALRAEIEQFVRGKIRFIDNLSDSPRIARPQRHEKTPA
ncbi:hypothetical protein [Lacipirellula parvula]|nr:hypothetical protein [Lacipirellula parvula]